MALTGVILLGYVVGHLAGNLQIYFRRTSSTASTFTRSTITLAFAFERQPVLGGAFVLDRGGRAAHLVLRPAVAAKAPRPPDRLRQEGRRSDRLRIAHHDVERPHHRGIHRLPYPAPHRRAAWASAFREAGIGLGGRAVLRVIRTWCTASGTRPSRSLTSSPSCCCARTSITASGACFNRWASAIRGSRRCSNEFRPLVRDPDRRRIYLDPDRGARAASSEARCGNGIEFQGPHRADPEAWDKRKFELKLVNPANKRKYQIIVVGSGLAGASAAATLAELGYNVLCFCFQDSPRRAHPSPRRAESTPRKIIRTTATASTGCSTTP